MAIVAVDDDAEVPWIEAPQDLLQHLSHGTHHLWRGGVKGGECGHVKVRCLHALFCERRKLFLD